MSFKMKARRAGWLLVVAAFALGIVSAIRPAPVDAYGLLSSRSIRLSSSANGATNTAHSVGFTTVTDAQTLAAIVIKYCANNPIIGDTCTAPTGFATNTATLTIGTQTGTTDMAINTTLSTANIVVLTDGTPVSITDLAINIVLGNGSTNGMTNPTNSNTTFYARILLFSTAPTATQVTDPAHENTAWDAGGTAMATANVLNVTAKVQETLVFCVYTGLNCGAGGNAIALGDANGVLSDTTVTYTKTANYDLASNALGGVVVRLKGNTLRSGTFSIDPHGEGTGGACVADSTLTSVEQFGIRVTAYGTGQQDPLAADDAYDCLAGNHKFTLAETNTTYGQDFVRTIGATDKSTSTFELAAKAAGTTEAGIYTTTLQMIATATY